MRMINENIYRNALKLNRINMKTILFIHIYNQEKPVSSIVIDLCTIRFEFFWRGRLRYSSFLIENF